MDVLRNITGLVDSNNREQILDVIIKSMDVLIPSKNITFQKLDSTTQFRLSSFPKTVNYNVCSGTDSIRDWCDTYCLADSERCGAVSLTFSNICKAIRYAFLHSCYELTRQERIVDNKNTNELVNILYRYLQSGEFVSHDFHCTWYGRIVIEGRHLKIEMHWKMYFHNCLSNAATKKLTYDTQQIDIVMTKHIMTTLFKESIPCNAYTVILYWITQKDALNNVWTQFIFFSVDELFDCLLPELCKLNYEQLHLTVLRMIDTENQNFAIWFGPCMPGFIQNITERKCYKLNIKENRGKTYDELSMTYPLLKDFF